MKELYRLLIEFKTLHPLRFWTAIFIATILIVTTIWRLKRKKRKSKIDGPENQIASILIDTDEKIIAQKTSIQKEEKPQPKAYLKTTDVSSLQVSEPKPVYIKSTETKDQKTTPKIEVPEVNPKAKIETTKSKTEQVEVKQRAKPKNQEQLPKAKEETTKSKDEVSFVNYQFLKIETINSYPVFRFPKKGTVVRSYRLGNTKRRGYKEESFQKSINDYFGNEFTILGNARLNTGEKTRPFEPDIALVDKSTNTNLRIDIEIDEPYAGITREPTHCKGDDVNRDNYFVDRGWIVIRFSEYQVHLNEKGCLKFIAEIINSAIPKYVIPIQLQDHFLLEPEKLWDIVQAQKWEIIKHRENYLNHRFVETENEVETIERNFNELEKKEEELVTPTEIGEEDTKELLGFNPINIHSRDKRIKFYPEPHTYTIDKVPVPSVSTIISKFFPEFDSFEKASNLSTNNPLFGLPTEDIVQIWKQNGIDAANLGTHLHTQIEKFYLKQEFESSPEFLLFQKFEEDHKNLIPYRTEWRIFDEDYSIAGTIDLIAKNNNSYEIYDWKRSKKLIDKTSGMPIIKDTWGKTGVGYLSTISDTSFNQYCIQQSIYRLILENKYEMSISKMYLVVLYPEYDKYYKLEVPYQKDIAEYILKTL